MCICQNEEIHVSYCKICIMPIHFYILHKIYSGVDFFFFDPFLSKAGQHLSLQKNDLNSKCYATVIRSFHIMCMYHISHYVWIRKCVFVLYAYIYMQDIRFNLIKQFCLYVSNICVYYQNKNGLQHTLSFYLVILRFCISFSIYVWQLSYAICYYILDCRK